MNVMATGKFDTSKSGLNAFFKDYQILAFQVLWETKGAVSKDVWIKVNEKLEGKSISRASIINFLEDMRKKDTLEGEETTGKGGKFYIYSMAMDESQFKEYLAKHLIETLLNDYPEETRLALKKIRGWFYR